MSGEIQLFNSEYARVTIAKDSQTAQIVWKKQAEPDHFWEASYHAMQYIALGSIQYCIFIHEDQIRIPPDHRLWLKYIAMPEAKKFGVKRLATLSKHAFPVRAAHNLHDILFGSRSLPHRCFASKEAMYQWLYGA